MSALQTLKQQLADFNALNAAGAMMSWDQQTYMPSGGADARAVHSGILGRMAHEVLTCDKTLKALEGAGAEAGGDDIAMLRVVRRDIDLATKIPADLVQRKLSLASSAQQVWVAARANNDFGSFAPNLEEMFEICGEEAKHLGYSVEPYDALLDQYEQGATAADATKMFETIKGPQVELLKRIRQAEQPDDSFLYGEWSVSDQSKFTQMLVSAIGFDLNRGRQDTAPHPFCTGWSIGDVRLTTRYKPYLGAAIFGSLHEAGHGMYEQGSPMKWDLTPLAGGTSLGVHESQSRTWENIVGRSKAFWTRFLPDLKQAFPSLGDVSLDRFYKAINKVESSLIRVEADELTYNLHVLVRFEIERAVLNGKLAVRDIPEAWNAKYTEYLGVTPETDSVGCLQDVHWSGGSIGYFPTYSMGNLLSYQIWNTMKKEVPNPEDLMAQGDFKPMLGWLQRNVYSKGRSLPPKELVMQVTGKPMGAEDYLAGLNAKYSDLYNL
jgi:carboxypeptidase Taq